MKEEDSRDHDPVEVRVTCASRSEAERISAQLLARRLAAGVQILGPITSRYWWHGRLETAEEWCCWAKTRAGLSRTIVSLVREMHTYEVPEVIIVPIVGGNGEYMQWIRTETRPEDESLTP